METTITELKKAIQNMHNCGAEWQEAIPVKEIFEGQTVWEGTVQVFNLIAHPSANRCYAWSYLVEKSGRRKFFAVLHQGPVNSPRTAVQAAIVSEHKT